MIYKEEYKMNKAHEVLKQFVPNFSIRFIHIPTGTIEIGSFEELMELPKDTIDSLFSDDFVYDIGTGAKDINGNEIFTRDIAKLTDDAIKMFGSYRRYVTFGYDSDWASFLFGRNIPAEMLNTYMYMSRKDLEVVGNIHLNPDLLTKEDSVIPIDDIAADMLKDTDNALATEVLKDADSIRKSVENKTLEEPTDNK